MYVSCMFLYMFGRVGEWYSSYINKQRGDMTMEQVWRTAEVTSCAIWDCSRHLELEWALSYYRVNGELYTVCQGGHTNGEQILREQIAIVEESAQRIAQRRAQKKPPSS